jgi:hypothetical protein
MRKLIAAVRARRNVKVIIALGEDVGKVSSAHPAMNQMEDLVEVPVLAPFTTS